MMSNCRIFVVLNLFLFLLLSQSTAHAREHIAYRNFWHPTYHGQRLAYCQTNKNTCGKPVADCYCRMMGYDYAKQQIIANNVGLTHYLGTDACCKGWTCNGFMTIECAKKISHSPAADYYYRKKRFAYPRYQHYRIDWCYDDHRGCGARAAKSFCRRLGYMTATDYKQEKCIGASKTLGSQKLCFGPTCDGFKYVICKR